MAKSVSFSPQDILMDVASKNHRQAEMALSDFLDYCIDTFAVENYQKYGSMSEILSVAKDKCRPYFTVILYWLTEVDREMNKGLWKDWFGETYEAMYLTKSKASRTGQFFTPHSVSDLLADIVVSKTENNASQRINDCACGSGRLLLSHYMKNSSPEHCGRSVGYYVAQDIDIVSCKMCALNMMAHGMCGEVHCQDTLLMTPPTVSFYVNEVRNPIPTPYYSIRKVG